MFYDGFKQLNENVEEESAISDEDETIELNENSKRANGNDKKKKKKLKNELYKPPTNEEMNRLRETENLFNSSLFRMQIEEMLNEINVKQKRINEFEKWLQEFDGFIKNLPEHDDMLVSDLCFKEQNTKKNKFINTLIENRFEYVETNQDLKLKFVKPESYTSSGFYKINCGLKSFTDFNVNVVMPKSIFNQKDYLNNIYFVRRYYYLLYVATYLKKSKLCKSMFISYLDDNELLPVLVLIPKQYLKIKVKITFILESDHFKANRFYIDKNNVKTKEEFVETTTALYNATILRDVTMLELNAKIEKMLDTKNIQDGIKLLIVWLTQRNLNCGFISFQNRYVLYVMMYLLDNRKINKMMSSYQVVRIFWNFVSTTNWNKEPVSLTQHIKDIHSFREHYDVNFIDFTGNYNLMSFLNLDIYNKLRNEATLALQYLDCNKSNAFDVLFMIKMPIIAQWDTVLSLQDNDNFDNIHNLTTDKEKFQFLNYRKELIVKKLTSYIKQGLRNRIKQIVPYYSKEIEWEMGRVSDFTFNKIIFGINLDPEMTFSPIVLGPPEYDEKAEEFRKFWGSLCELRRFADNKVCEAVYIKCDTVQERRQVFKKLLHYIIGKKLKLKYKLAFDEYESMLSMKNFVLSFKTGTNEEVFQRIRNSFDKLREKLRNIKIQLGVSSVQCSSEMYSYTDPFPAIPANYKCGGKVTKIHGDNIVFKTDIKMGLTPRYVAPIECVFQLVRDSKWPNEIKALRAIITEFYFEISKLLKEDHSITSKVKEDHMDILFEGLVFRLRLYQPKEVLLLKKYVNEEGLTTYQDTLESLNIEKRLNILPSLISALNGLMLQYPSYGPSTCLIKRWLRSQLIDDHHFPDIAIDLVNASLYLETAPFERSNLPQIAFIRFLKFIAEADFVNQAVIVNFNEQITVEDLNETLSDFQKCRTKYPSLYIITPYDDMQSLFTTQSPSITVLRRVAVLALETFKYTDNCVMGPGQLHVEELFIPNRQGYNALIHLNVPMLARRYQYVQAKNMSVEIESYEETHDSKIPVVDFDPVQTYLHTLRKAYDEFALFFYDTYGGPFIAVLWLPDVHAEKDFKAMNTQCKEVVNGKLTFNENAAIEDFYIIGDGLVKNIEVL